MRKDQYPYPHDVALVGRSLEIMPRPCVVQSIVPETVVVDGKPLCLPKNTMVRVEADAGGAAFTLTFSILAAAVRTEPYEYVPKHMAAADGLG